MSGGCDHPSFQRSWRFSSAQQPDRGGPGRSAVNSSEKRLARLLILLAQIGSKQNCARSPCRSARSSWRRASARPFAHQLLHEQVPPSIGLIEYNGELKVHSSLLNLIVQD